MNRGFDDGHGAQSQGYYGGHDQGGNGGYGHNQGQYGGGHHAARYDDGHGEKKDKDGAEKDKDKKSDKGGMMLGAAVGVGAGLIGGALLANALGTSRAPIPD